ncbi:MAG: DUF4387 family protein [Pseudomonadota bacterium]
MANGPMRLGDRVEKVRSKNAGPFWLTIDIFCGSKEVFKDLRDRLETGTIANALNADEMILRRFDIESLNVIKFSLPRPAVQGSIADRDMHGASFGALIAEIEL